MSCHKGTAEQLPTVGQPGEKATEFLAENGVTPELAAEMMKLAPANPFCTKSFTEAMSANGHQTWLLGTKRGGKLVAGCYGFISSGRLNRRLRILSLPDVPCEDVYWDGLMAFCSEHQIHHLELNNYPPLDTRIPPLPGQVERFMRSEYVLDLKDPEWERKLARNHRRNIQKALQNGVTLRRDSGPAACREHVRLMEVSLKRRRRQGDSASVPGGAKYQWSLSLLLTEKGIGELFQAVAGGQVLSSTMVLRAAEGAHNYTAGSSPEGMQCGASHFLVHSVARLLRQEGMAVFNFGCAGESKVAEDRGLILFKMGFGATPVPLEYACFYLGSDLRRNLTRAARPLRQCGSAFLRWIGATGIGSQRHSGCLDWRVGSSRI